ncbi:MAG: hypothetical protein RLY21_37 [Planctomycetota bacterium]
MGLTPDSARPPTEGGLAAKAAHGSAWTTAQTVLNKLVTVGANVILAHLLAPGDYGLAFLAANIAVYFFVLPTYVMGDVMLANARRFDAISGAVNRIAWIAGAVMFVALAALALPIEYLDGHSGLAILIVAAATRVLADAALAVAFARMRLDLEYRRIAMVDGSVILGATLLGLAMAYFGAGAASITVPPIAAIAARGLIYRRIKARQLNLQVARDEVRPVVRQYVEAGLGQYLNNIILGLEIVVLGFMTNQTELGLFVFAANNAIQANSIIAGQLGAVLQPIFSHIHDDPHRQIRAFVRATRLLSAIAVPLSLIQAVLAVPAFVLLFPPDWTGSIAVFAVLSVAQAFMFVTAPSVALLKSQGRFRAYLGLQFTQALLSAITFVVAIWLGGDEALHLARSIGLPVDPAAGKALALSIASAAIWAVFCPITVWIAGRPAKLGVGATLGTFFEPWIVAVPVAALLVVGWLGLRAALSSQAADIATVVALAPLAAVVGIVGCVLLRADTRADARSLVERFTRRRRGAG